MRVTPSIHVSTLSTTLPSGGTYHYAYDDRGNQTEVSDDAGNVIFERVYNPDGSIASLTDRFGTVTYDYGAQGMPVRVIGADGTITIRPLGQDANTLAEVDRVKRSESAIIHEPYTLPPVAKLADALRLKHAKGVSGIPIIEDDGTLIGIITDRDLRERVLARGIDPATSVDRVMSNQIITLDDNAYVFEATLLMLRHNIHHLPIVQRQKPVGVLALSDLMRHESKSSILLVRSIFKMSSIEELKIHAGQLPAVFVRMVKEDANSHMIGSAMAATK